MNLYFRNAFQASDKHVYLDMSGGRKSETGGASCAERKRRAQLPPAYYLYTDTYASLDAAHTLQL